MEVGQRNMPTKRIAPDREARITHHKLRTVAVRTERSLNQNQIRALYIIEQAIEPFRFVDLFGEFRFGQIKTRDKRRLRPLRRKRRGIKFGFKRKADLIKMLKR